MTPTDKLLTEIRDAIQGGATQRFFAGPVKAVNPRLETLFDGVELPLVLGTVIPTPVDIRRFGNDFQEVCKYDVHHYARGLILVQVDSVKPPAALLFGAEVQVSGIISGVRDILATAAVNSATGPLPVTVAKPYDYVRVAARQLVNGFPDNVTNSPLLNCSVTARFHR